MKEQYVSKRNQRHCRKFVLTWDRTSPCSYQSCQVEYNISVYFTT